VRPRPGAVGLERPSFVRAEVDLVQAGEDDAGHVAPAEADRERLLRPGEACRDAEVDVHSGEPLAQLHRLRDAKLGETLARRAGADDVVEVRLRVPVPDEQERPQNRTLR
jgi:hypothetical protein